MRNSDLSVGDTILIHDQIDDNRGRMVNSWDTEFKVVKVSKSNFTIRGVNNVDIVVSKETIDIFSNIYTFRKMDNQTLKVPVVEKL